MTQNFLDNEYALRPLVTKMLQQCTLQKNAFYVEMGLAYPPGVKTFLHCCKVYKVKNVPI